jgi:hypothetical protein
MPSQSSLNLTKHRPTLKLQLINFPNSRLTTMDAPEDDLDIKLQKISGDLIVDFDKSLRPFLRKPDGAGGTASVRSRVRARETERLISSVSYT